VRPSLFESVLSFDRALAIVLESVAPIDRTEIVPLEAADGRVAARDLVSTLDVPRFDRAAMDGYAVLAEDTAGATKDTPRHLTRTGGLFTGDVSTARLAQGECMDVATGAPIPAGTSAVVMVEETSRDGDVVHVYAQARLGQNIGRRAADIASGQRVIAAGDVLTPSRIGALAAIGLSDVPVYARPTVAILSTGNEVVPPGEPLGPSDVYDINRFTVGAVVRRHGGVTTALPPAGDTLEELHLAVDRISDHDIAIFSGGSSVGGRDLMSDVLRARGDVRFHGIAVKPGKPTLFAIVGHTRVFGMPGYPTSCLSNAYMLLLLLLRATARLPPWQPETRTLPLGRRIASTPNRHQFYTVRIVDGRAEPAFKASGDITSMANADGYIEIPIGTDAVDEGTLVAVKLF
jgi:molybdopterin molybdotransferase